MASDEHAAPSARIGTITGALYAQLAVGLVLLHRTTGVLNLAHGSVGLLSGYVAYEIIIVRHLPYPLGVIGAVGIAGLTGLLFERLVIRRLPGRPDMQTAATLCLSLLLQGFPFIVPWWQNHLFQVLPSPLSDRTVVAPGSGQAVTYDQLLLVAASLVLAGGLYVFLRRTRAGLATRAVSDNAVAASMMGIQPDRVRRDLWVFSFALSGLTTILVAPITLLNVRALNALNLKGLVAGCVGGLVSFPLTALGAMALGTLEAADDLLWTGVSGLTPWWPLILLAAAHLIRNPQPHIRD